MSTDPATDVGTQAWLDAQSESAAIYHGDPWVIDVVVKGDRSGTGFTYHVELVDGFAPRFVSGPAPAAAASLELSRSDAEEEARGVPAVVGYMRGTTKTKGATKPLYELFRVLARR